MAQHTLAIRAYLSYKNLAEKHIIPEIGNIKLSRQRVDHLQKLYSDKLNAGLSRRTVQNIHQFLHTVLEYAVKWGMLVKNLSDLSQAPSQEKEPATVLTPSQAKRLLEMVKDTRYFALYLTANPLGLREGELLGLSWSAIDWEKHTLRVEKQLRYIPGQGLLLKASKTKSAYRTLPLPNIIYTVLHQFREESIKTGMIFHTSVKTPYIPRNILRHFHSLLKRMELPAMPFHNLRHTCASFHLAAGTNPRIVQEILGHSSVTVTLSVYSHLLPGVSEEATSRINKILDV